MKIEADAYTKKISLDKTELKTLLGKTKKENDDLWS